ncbi:LOW QUALITY PROTEIN: 1-phosphatidylinositol 4,5-bisphosphate phosphodiesterase eta-2-like [Mantella aurantiaca]
MRERGSELEKGVGTRKHTSMYTMERCMSSMQAGTQMIKLRGSSKGLVRFYYLDEHKSCIRWRPSRKNEKAKISIDSIQEVCEGKRSEIFQRYADGSFNPNCCFSIYYGDHMESLDLVSSSGEEARTWITGLKYLMAGISDEDSLSKRQRTRDQYPFLHEILLFRGSAADVKCDVNWLEICWFYNRENLHSEADTDDNQGTLGFDEFCTFYKMMSTRRDLYLLMLTYSNHKDHLNSDDLKRFLETEQKMTNVTKEYCLDIVTKFEPCPENKKDAVLGIDGFTSYMRCPAGDVFNPEHYNINQDMTFPLSNYFIASSHNTYLMGDQLMSQSRADMYAWVLQAGCRCVEVDCWDGPDGEPIVHHGYTLTSKILFKDVIETINKYAFIRNEFPVILSIENHCSVLQQKKMAQYLTEILGDKLDLSAVMNGDLTKLPSPDNLRGKILVKGKKLPAGISDDAEEGDVSDEDSADDIDEDCKLINGDASTNRKQVENIAKKRLDSLMKESKIRDCEDPNNFTVTTLTPSGKRSQKAESKKKYISGNITERSLSKMEEELESGEEPSPHKRLSRSLMGSFSKHKRKVGRIKKSSSLEEGEESLERQGSLARASVHYSRMNRQKKTMKLSRALSDLVKYTKSVGIHDVETEISCSWQVSSFSETKAHQILQQKSSQFVQFNQQQLSRIYPSSYRVDSSNYNPQPFWNAGCQLVALNYQSEGRMLQLNRAKFNRNGSCGYVLKPKYMCHGAFNPNSDDPSPGQMKKQLILRIISGQQLPKPKDSMLGDRGEVRTISRSRKPMGFWDSGILGLRDSGTPGFWDFWDSGILGPRDSGALGFWGSGILGLWDFGTLGLRNSGTLGFWDSGILRLRDSGSLGLRDSRTPGFWDSGILGLRDSGALGFWDSGILGLRDSGALGFWDSGILDLWDFGTLGLRNSGTLGFWDSGILGLRDSGILGLWDSRTPGFWNSGILDLWDWDFGISGFWDSGILGRWDSGILGLWISHVDRQSLYLAVWSHAFYSSLTCPHPLPIICPSPFSWIAFFYLGSCNLIADNSDTKEITEGFHTLIFTATCWMTGFNPMWEETLVFTIHMPEISLIRFLVWDHDPIGRDFIGQRTLSFSSIMPGYRHVYLEGMEEASIFVHVAINDISGKVKQAVGLKGLFLRNPKQASLDSHAAGQLHQKHSISSHILRRTASAPTKGQQKHKKGFPEIAIDSKDNSSEGASEDRETDDSSIPRFDREAECASPSLPSRGDAAPVDMHSKGLKDSRQISMYRSISSLCSLETITEESAVAKETPFPSPIANPAADSSKGCGEPTGSPSECPNAANTSDTAHRANTEPHAATTWTASTKNTQILCKDPNLLLTIHGEHETTLTFNSASMKPGMCLLADVSRDKARYCHVKENKPEQFLHLINRTTEANEMSGLHEQQIPSNPIKHSQGDRMVQRPSMARAGPPVPVRRTKSEGHVISNSSALSVRPSPAAQVYSDATMHDKIWSKLEWNSHRDSLSSSSSKSSNDTVIDLSLPNLAQKGLLDLHISEENFESIGLKKTMRPRSATTSAREISLGVTKSKSNPNLMSNNRAIGELCPRPLLRNPAEVLPPLPRRNTWNRLYVESLKQSASKANPNDKASTSQSMSKSLGDLTSDDIICNFESKYRSISRSFITRSQRVQRRSNGAKASKSTDSLTEQLKKLTSFEKENDITSPIEFQPLQYEDDGTNFLRRTSSRSQSRVRHIANRAKQAQERQRLQNLVNSNSIEERGNPEGACAITKGNCMDSFSPSQYTAESLDNFGP